ncbi:hypothetical protein CTAYLR_010386 [Chrysophaeum taylorii]|uniref:RRM domain-containing protein n=1 Tax=Chrysophaeum taylorii TaxID=2483200 RepID=A0AAD7XHT0_9STRA|nr:hypothetical protein CTAYLR_010386 [Chrysophaeum taylorii]
MGLVPIVPDAATKPRRELFVGNTPPQTTERMLIDHLNAAMSTMRMNSAPGAPVVQCRVSANFAFVELRTIEETDRALSLTGIPFMGHVLKIGRPSKYDGPVTPASTWQQLLVEGGFDRDGAPSGFPHEAAAALSMSPGDPASEKVCRELFIGNTSALMTESSIRAFLGLVARQLGQVIGPGDPIISLRLSGHFAFVELRSVEETDAMLQFNGIPFQGSQLRIGRPSKYAGPQHRASEEPRWIDVLDKYRKGDLQPLEIRGAAAVMEPPPLARADVDDLEKLTLDPHRTIVLRRILEETDPEDIPDNEDDARRRRTAVVDGILDEVQRECAKYGTVVSATPDGDDLLVRFSLVDHAILALATLRHRLFDGRKLRVEFVPESPALPPPTPGDHNRDVNPPAPPPPPENYSDFAHYGLL